MSFLHTFAERHDPLGKTIAHTDPIGGAVYKSLAPKTPPPTPGVPDPNAAANAAQNLTDQMRMRRGLMANIYAGAGGPAPVSGKTQLGT
jgi:hypothetical protein